MGGRSPSVCSRFRAMHCRFNKARYIRPCRGLNVVAGLQPAGGRRKTTGVQSTTNLARVDASQLEAEQDAWKRLTIAVSQVLEIT